jgi:hypothetical protein
MVAHFAQLDQNNVVLQVIVVSNNDVDNLPFPESEPIGIAFCQSLFGADTIWKQTSYNNKFRRQYAGIGGGYSPSLDVFYDSQPYPSWSFDEATANWVAPIPMPDPVPADAVCVWNESRKEWDVIRGVNQ